MSEFIENFIFENEKDTPFRNGKEFYGFLRDKYKIDKSPELYKKIVNYQINKYGEALNNTKLIDNHTKGECITKCVNARQRKYTRLKYERKEN